MTAEERIGNAIGIAALVALPIVVVLTIYLSRRVEARTIGQAREERGRGIPLDNAQRAARHYGITPEQYLACPQCYPLPDRGTGLYG